jgi:hypothetical protein
VKNNSKNGEIKMKKLTQEMLKELTMRVKNACRLRYRNKISELAVLSQLQYVNGIIFIRVSWRQTISKQDEILVVGSTGSSVDDGIDVFNVSF